MHLSERVHGPWLERALITTSLYNLLWTSQQPLEHAGNVEFTIACRWSEHRQ